MQKFFSVLIFGGHVLQHGKETLDPTTGIEGSEEDVTHHRDE
jgi:hypothetical protein